MVITNPSLIPLPSTASRSGGRSAICGAGSARQGSARPPPSTRQARPLRRMRCRRCSPSLSSYRRKDGTKARASTPAAGTTTVDGTCYVEASTPSSVDTAVLENLPQLMPRLRRVDPARSRIVTLPNAIGSKRPVTWLLPTAIAERHKLDRIEDNYLVSRCRRAGAATRRSAARAGRVRALRGARPGNRGCARQRPRERLLTTACSTSPSTLRAVIARQARWRPKHRAS